MALWAAVSGCWRRVVGAGRQGSITKVGNSHVRRLLVDSAWHARRRPKVGYDLARRRRGQDAPLVERAWRCQQRLYQRWQRMAGRGKPQQKIAVACAGEHAGFVRAIATTSPSGLTDHLIVKPLEV